MKKEITFDLKIISFVLLILLIIIFFSNVLKNHMTSYECFPVSDSISRLDYLNIVSVILVILLIFESIINIIIITKSQLFFKLVYIIITIVFFAISIFELYILENNFFCGKEEVLSFER